MNLFESVSKPSTSESFLCHQQDFETLLFGLEKVHEDECSCYTLTAVYDDVLGSMSCSGVQSQVLNAELMYACFLRDSSPRPIVRKVRRLVRCATFFLFCDHT